MAVEYSCCESKFFINIGVIVLLVLFAGLMSGLTLGLMSLSLVDLEVLAKSGTPQDRKHAGHSIPFISLSLSLSLFDLCLIQSLCFELKAVQAGCVFKDYVELKLAQILFACLAVSTFFFVFVKFFPIKSSKLIGHSSMLH